MAASFQGNRLCSSMGAGVCLAAGCTALLVAAFPTVQIAFGAAYMNECPAAPVIPIYLMVSGVWALIMMALFALPKLLRPAAAGHTIWTVWIITLLLFIFIWFLFGSYQIYSIYPPNYHKNTTVSNSSRSSSHSSPAPKSELGFNAENQTVLSLNKTQISDSNQTSWIQTLTFSNKSRRTSREPSKIQQEHQMEAEVLYCNRTVYMFAFWTTTLVYALAGNALVIFICVYGFVKCTDIFVKHLTP